MQNFETIDDAQLDQVAGGLSFSLGFDTSTGLTATTPIGSVTIANPITVATDLIGGVTGALGQFLTKFGDKLGQLGQLFDFS